MICQTHPRTGRRRWVPPRPSVGRFEAASTRARRLSFHSDDAAAGGHGTTNDASNVRAPAQAAAPEAGRIVQASRAVAPEGRRAGGRVRDVRGVRRGRIDPGEGCLRVRRLHLRAPSLRRRRRSRRQSRRARCRLRRRTINNQIRWLSFWLFARRPRASFDPRASTDPPTASSIDGCNLIGLFIRRLPGWLRDRARSLAGPSGSRWCSRASTPTRVCVASKTDSSGGRR